jgi:putative DNA primase/helicase
MLDDMVARGFLSVADSGTGHDRCYLVACEMRDLGISETVTNEMMLDRWYKFCTPNDDKSFVRERVASCFKGAQNEAGAYACAPAAETFAHFADQIAKIAADACASLPRADIQLIEGEIVRAVDEAEAALIERKANIYTFGNLLVRPGIAQYTVAGGDKDRGVRLIPMTKPSMLEAFSTAALFWRFDQRSEELKRKDCPDKIAELYLARDGGWKLRKLTGVIHAPTLRHDGSILETPGYDIPTGLLYDPLGQVYPAIPQSPTKADAVAALALYKELLKEFPFVDKPSLSVALSAISTGLVRRNLTNAPLHAFTAPAAGTGKSLLVDCAAIVATGKPMPVIAQGASEEETAKRLAADLIAGSPFVSLDNCTDALSGALLCQVLTQETVKVRVLGLSKNVDVLANMMVFANGNNLTVAGDLTRRVIMGTLDSKVERPELRHFSGKPDDIIRDNRGRYVVAALTVLRAFIVAGSPSQTPPLGSYEEWSHLVRDALVWCGEADPCATMDALTASDPEREDLGRLLYFWNAVIGHDRVTVKKVSAATSGDTTDAKSGLHEALGAIAGHAAGRGTDAIDHKKLGHYLARHQGQVVNGMSLVRAGITDGTVAWQLYPKKES